MLNSIKSWGWWQVVTSDISSFNAFAGITGIWKTVMASLKSFIKFVFSNVEKISLTKVMFFKICVYYYDIVFFNLL